MLQLRVFTPKKYLMHDYRRKIACLKQTRCGKKFQKSCKAVKLEKIRLINEFSEKRSSTAFALFLLCLSG